MTKHWTRTLLLLACLIAGGIAQAQVLTNKDLLQKASQNMADLNRNMQVRLLTLAKQKNWPIILHSTKGKMAFLMGVDPGGFPIYTTTTDNIISAATIRTTTLWPGGASGLNLSGSSANMSGKIAVWDEGKVRATHVELTGRVTQKDAAATISDHSTHVSGTLIAAGVNPLAKGMSFGAQQLLAYDFNNDASEMAAAAGNGLLVSSHSYATIAGWFLNSDQNNRWEFWGAPGDTSDFKFGDYDATTQLWDSIAYNAPNYLISKASGNNRDQNGPAVGQPYYRFNSSGVMAAAGNRPAGISSNNGYNIIATYGVAKNILTLGAIAPIPGGYNSPSDAAMTSFSSWGPTADGRIKPDVVADGLDVLSCIGTSDNAYDIFSGTSMATPAAAGSSFLLQELYSKIHGRFMRSATLKGLIIHTADEAGPNPGPDYMYGWGVINMQKAASVITSDTAGVRDQQIYEKVLTQGTHDVDNFSVVASGKTPVTATISWTDPPATPNTTTNHDTTRKLVNDLDVRISDGTTTYMPWILNPANPGAAATRGDNFRDNLEKIEIDSLIPGKTYTISVTHKGTLARGSQAYSLLVSGVGGQTYCTSASTGGGASIDQISIGGLTNNPGNGTCRTYTDFSNVAAARLPVGNTVPITIVHSACNGTTNTRVISVYIDYNDDGVFEANELAAQSAAVPPGTFNANVTIPGTAKTGSYTRMRVIAEETGSPSNVNPCGTYGNGETQDYRVLFSTPSIDVGVTQLEDPTQTTCGSDSQIVTVHIRNFGSIVEDSIPVTTVIKTGSTTVATLTAVCKDTIQPGQEVLFTYNTTFQMLAGTTYTFTSSTSLSTDLNTGDDQNVTGITVSAGPGAPTGSASICGTTATQAILKTSSATGNDIAFWYDSPTASTPIAIGSNATTNDIPSNKTYYLAVNDLKAKVGPVNKLVFDNGQGAYFGFGGNYVSFTTSVPLTIESARMYIGNSGKMRFTLAQLANSTYANGYSYFQLYQTTIDVYATTPTPAPGTVNVPAGSTADQGAIYYLNIPIPTPGSYIIIIDNLDNSTAFLNAGNTNIPYPVGLPGIMQFTGTYIYDGVPADTSTFAKKVYFPFYDLGVRLEGCASPRVPVVAATPASPTITLNGDVFTSSIANGNQWYRDNTSIPGAIHQTDTAIYSGLYYTIVTDPSGCSLQSNSINFTSTATTNLPGSQIGLTVSPNPNPGVFQLSFNFTAADNLSVTLVNTLGQEVYRSDYPDFAGAFSKTIDAGALASGMYVLKIQHGNDVYVKKILVRR